MHRRLGKVLLALAMGCGDSDDTTRATATPTTAATGTRTAVATVSATATVPATATASVPAPTATVPPATAAATATVTIPPSQAATGSATPTVSLTPTSSLTPTPTATPRPPELTYFGIARADDLVQEPSAVDAQGRPIFERAQGQGMTLVVEGRRGSFPVATSAYNPGGLPPGVEFLVSRSLGDGSLAVCDYDPPIIGGIPGVDPPVFSSAPGVVDAIADFGCRVNDGTGQPQARTGQDNACTRDVGALFSFVAPSTTAQFCLPIAKAWAFPPGDTVVAARVRDVQGNVSAAREIVIRVAGEVPFDCGDGLGERVFTPTRPDSALFTTALAGDASIDPWIADPLRICAGVDLGDGVHPLTLREDMRFGLTIADGSVLCGKILARGSGGVLDCDGGTAQDVRAFADAATGRISSDTGLGLPAGTGAASLRAPMALLVLPANATPSDCFGARFGSEFSAVLTTAQGTADIVDANGTPLVTLSTSGTAFDCRNWRTPGGAALVVPIPAANTATSGDVAATLVLAE